MSDWAWEYSPDAAHVVGGLTLEQIAEVDSLAQRIADAVAVRRIGMPFDEQEAASDPKAYGEGSVLLWFQEYYRFDVVLVVRVQHLGATADPTPGNTAVRPLSIHPPHHRDVRLAGERSPSTSARPRESRPIVRVKKCHAFETDHGRHHRETAKNPRSAEINMSRELRP